MCCTTEWPFQNYSLFIRCTRYLHHGCFYAQRFDILSLIQIFSYSFPTMITEIESNIPSQISSDGKLCFHFWSSNFRIKFIHFSFFLIQKTENDSSSGGWFHYFSYQEAEKFTMSRVGVTFRTKQSEFFMYPTQVYGLCFNSIHQSESFATQLQGNAGCGFLCKEGTKFFSCCFTYC